MTTGAVKLKEFYRKPLPTSCIDFASIEGKTIFTEALSGGTMNGFFNLAAQFRTQDEPAYCGLSTLVMVLNALSVDPGRIWKGPWRWYHEDMLECCVPLKVAQTKGITIFHFTCLAMCNSLDVDMVQALPTASIEQFRETVRRVTKLDDKVLVCSYSRRVLGQSGDGHFSPIGGYHPGRDLVLIFDVARFKYPPHWVSVDLLWEAMQGLDKDTGQPRGYFTLSQTTHTGNPTILFKISNIFDLALPSKMKPEVSQILQKWQTWLTSQCRDRPEKKEFLQILVSKFLSLWCSKCFPGLEQIFVMKIDVDCCSELSDDHKCAICNLLRSLEQQQIFQLVDKSLVLGEHVISECLDILVKLNERLCCEAKRTAGDDHDFPKIQLSHLATMMLLAWPYPTSDSAKNVDQSLSHAQFYTQYVSEEMANVKAVLQNEVALLKAQLSTIFSYYKSFNSPDVVLQTSKTSCCNKTQCKK